MSEPGFVRLTAELLADIADSLKRRHATSTRGVPNWLRTARVRRALA